MPVRRRTSRALQEMRPLSEGSIRLIPYTQIRRIPIEVEIPIGMPPSWPKWKEHNASDELICVSSHIFGRPVQAYYPSDCRADGITRSLVLEDMHRVVHRLLSLIVVN